MNNREIHYRYAISYLLTMIILIVALAYYDVPNLVDKFSFALTLSSLLLAILAIFYTIISAHKQDSQFSKIIEASSKLSVSVNDIEKASVGIANLSKDIPEQFNNIGTKLDDMSNKYGVLTERELSNSKAKESQDISQEDHEFSMLIMSLQFSAMAVLYWFTQASLKNKPIDLNEFEDFYMANKDYALGFLNGFKGTKLIDYKLHKSSIIPTKCDDILYTKLRDELRTIIKVISEKNSKELADAIAEVDQKYA